MSGLTGSRRRSTAAAVALLALGLSVAACGGHDKRAGSDVGTSSVAGAAGHGTTSPGTGPGSPQQTPAPRPSRTKPASSPSVSSPPEAPAGATSVCGLVPPDVVAQALGGEAVAQQIGPAVCLFHTSGARSLQISRLPVTVLGGQLGDGGFAPVANIGDKAYWNAKEGLLVAVKDQSELLVNVSAGDSEADRLRISTAVADAALPAL